MKPLYLVATFALLLASCTSDYSSRPQPEATPNAARPSGSSPYATRAMTREERLADLRAQYCFDPLWKAIGPKGQLSGRACTALPVTALYRSYFPKEPKRCCLVDLLPDGPLHLAVGESNLARSASGDPDSGKLSLTAPQVIHEDKKEDLTKAPSIGLFRTGLGYGNDARLVLAATFQRPLGKLDGALWGLGVTARSGGLDDAYDADRISATFRIKQGFAELGVGAGAAPGSFQPKGIGAERYSDIFVNGARFTLILEIDRRSGIGRALLAMEGHQRLELPFTIDPLLNQDGVVLTTIGATLADCCLPHETVAVEVRDFNVWDRVP